ncbi:MULTISPECIES: aminotransferase-like domain-containing protein [Cupriavidus]
MTSAERPAWYPRLTPDSGHLYRAIADAIERGIASGELAIGTRLPTQRSLARALGVDFTTVSRAYAEASARGLIEGQVGRGTFVLDLPAAGEPGRQSGAPLCDLSINHPPPLDDALQQRLWEELDQSSRWIGRHRFRRYPPPEGYAQDRMAGAQWLAPHVRDAAAERTLVCGGAQCALLAVASLLAGPGQSICVDDVTYVGLRMLAHRLGIVLRPVGMDRHGMRADLLEAACRAWPPAAVYCMPTLHNPTTITMPAQRRQAIVAVARRFGVPIIEDDNYWPLLGAPDPHAPAGAEPPSLADLAPELTFHVSGLSKCLSPALRVAYVRTPDPRSFERLVAVVRATSAGASPLGAALATRWIREGIATQAAAALAREGLHRQQLAQQRLGAHIAGGDRRGFHIWVTLPAPWQRGAFAAQLRQADILVTESDAFAAGTPPEAVRICLGGVPGQQALGQALDRIGALLASPAPLPAPASASAPAPARASIGDAA